MDLTLRLNILRDAGQIDDEIHDNLLKIIDIVKEKWGIELTEENGAMFITHMSIALKRIKENNIVEPMEDFLYEGLKKEKNFEKSEEMVNIFVQEINISIPEEEKSFIVMHLCTLLSL